METQIISQEEYKGRNLEREIDGAVVYDGDGDGTSAVAIWLMQNPGRYVAFTNQQKGERELVKGVFKTIPAEYLQRKKCGVFDISAEQNLQGLENLVQTASEVDFIDHHTQINVPNGIRNYAKPDSREISTAYLAYEAVKDRLDEKQKGKAIYLAILGLANDGKESAAKKLFANQVEEEKMNKLVYFGKVLNYAANLGNTLNFSEVLKGLVENDNILNYLENSQVAEVAKEMEASLAGLKTKITKQTAKGVEVYSFPYGTEKERVLATAAYSNYLNEKAAQSSSGTYIGLIKIPEGKTRVAIRGPNALTLAGKLAQEYGAKHAGRETAAGFDTERQVKEGELIEKLGGI